MKQLNQDVHEQLKGLEERILAVPGNHHDIYKSIEHVRTMIREKETQAQNNDLHVHELDMKSIHWFANVIVRGLVEEVLKNTVEDLENRYEKSSKHYSDGVE